MSAGKIFSSILGGVGTILGMGSPPKPKPPPLMPDPNDPLLLNQKRQDVARAAAAQGGRASTILSGADYSATTLGSG